MLIVSLELGDFDDFNVYWCRKYAEFLELGLKIQELNIQPVSWLKTQMQCETFAKKWGKNFDMDWAQHVEMDYAQN